jgi:hypothetical protein
MGFSLKNLLQDAEAQFNMRDGGKTASTMRAARRASPAVTPPANVTIRQPQQPKISVTGNQQNPLGIAPPQSRVTPVSMPQLTPPAPVAPAVPALQVPSAPKPAAPAPVAPKAAPLPDQQFKGISEGQGKNKTIFGMNAAAVLPKQYEKTYEVKADRNVSTNKDKYVAQYDQLHPDYQKILVNSAREQAAKGDKAAQNTLQALQESGRLKGGADDFMEGANDKLYGGLTRAALRTTDFVLPGHNTFGLEHEADVMDPSKQGTNQVTQAGKFGEKVGSVEKGVVDLGTMVVPGVAAQRGLDATYTAEKTLQAMQRARALGMTAEEAAPLIKQATNVPKLVSIGTNLVADTLTGLPIQAAQQVGQGNDIDLKDAALMTVGADVGLPLVGKGIKMGYDALKNSGADDVVTKSVPKLISAVADDAPAAPVVKPAAEAVPAPAALTAEQQIEQNFAKLDAINGEQAKLDARVAKAAKLAKEGSQPSSSPQTFLKAVDQHLAAPESEIDRVLNGETIPKSSRGLSTGRKSLANEPADGFHMAGEAADHPAVKKFHEEYADSLRQMESGLKGGEKIPDGEGGYIRTSEHTPFYRKHFAENGRAPGKQDWIDEAKRQLDSGKADEYAQKHYDDLKNPETRSLLDQPEGYHAPDTRRGEHFPVPEFEQHMIDNGMTPTAAKAQAHAPVEGEVINPGGKGKKPVSAAVKHADLDEITYSTKEKKAPVKDRIKQFFDDAQSAAIDRYHPIDQLSKGKNLAPSEDPSYLIKRYSGGAGIASERIDADLKPIVRSVDDLDNFRKYLIANRMTELSDRGIGKSGEGAIAQMGEKIGTKKVAQFQKAADQLYAYQRKNLDMLHEVGALSDDQYKAITSSNQKYVPFQRVMDDLEQGGFLGTSSKDLNVKSNGIKRIKGSDRDIVDPLESVIKQTYDVQKIVEKQRTLNALVKVGEFEKIDPKIVPVGKVTHTAEVDREFMDKLGGFAKNLGLRSFKTEGKAGKRLAYYQPGAQSVTRHLGTSRETAAHEIGHFLDDKFKLKGKFYAKGESKDVGQELIQNMKNIGQSAARTKSPDERFAHAFEWYLLHPSQASKDLPLFSKRMDQIIAETPGLKGLKDIKPSPRASVEGLEETVFGKSPFEPKDPHITVLEDGRPVYYKTDAALADAIKGIDEEQLNAAVKVMSVPAKMLRAGATSLNVGFAVPNIIRDQLSAAVNNKYGGVPIYDFVNGLASVIKQDDAYKGWMKSGADQAGFFAQDRKLLQRDLDDIVKGGAIHHVGKVVKNPLELLRAIGEFSEKGSRVGVYKRAFKGAGKEGLEGFDQELMAMKQARESTIDFSRRGSKMKAYNAITPFLNARLQGSLKLMDSIKKRPIQTGAIGMAYAGLPAAVLYAHNSQYPEYDEVPDYIKQNYFVIMTGKKDTPFLKIPKGEIGMIFGNPTENFLANIKQHQGADAFKKTAANILLQFSPVQDPSGAIPTAFGVPAQVMTNYDMFRKQNIVSPYKKDLPAGLQDNNQTSETAKAVGQKLNVSPAKLEFVARSLTGGLAKQFTQITDRAVFGADMPVQNAPVIDRFIGEPKDLSASAQKIYEQTDKMKQDRAIENYKIKEALKNGDLSVLDGVSGSRKSSLQNSVKDDAIQDNLTPQQKALYNATQEQRDMLREGGDKKLKKDLDYIDAISGSSSSSSNPDKLSDAEEAKFKSSKDKTFTKGNTQYYKTGTGVIKSKDKFEYTADKEDSNVKLEMDRAKASGSYDQWQKAAVRSYANIVKRMRRLDPDTESEQVDALTLKAENLMDEMSKFAGYGGLTKPKSGREKSKSSNGFDYTKINAYADSTTTGKSLRAILADAKISGRKKA